MKKSNVLRVATDSSSRQPRTAAIPPCPVTRAVVLHPPTDGLVAVACHGDVELRCEVIETLSSTALDAGDTVMVALPAEPSGFGVILGRVVRHGIRQDVANVVLQAAHTLSLQCGLSSIDLRADGKVVIKGDDVLVRAKGTKRIRAGSVSIN
jgi:hypothetical protein